MGNPTRLPAYYYGIVVGLILSDGYYLKKQGKLNWNAQLYLKQSLDHFSYLWFTFSQLSHYCSNYPKITTGVRSGKKIFGVLFYTRALPCFTQLYKLFYVDGVKTIPSDIYYLWASHHL